MATPALTVLDEDKHAWFAGRTRAILKYLDAELGPNQPGHIRKVLDIGGGEMLASLVLRECRYSMVAR